MKPKYYHIIESYYKDKKTSKGVPYINHIDEGIEILKDLKADPITIQSYILHPFIQCVNLKGADGKIILTKKKMKKYLDIYSINPAVTGNLFLYRKFANAYLCRPETDNLSLIDIKKRLYGLERYPNIIDMLITDKLQNFKDFMKYRQDHPRYDQLFRYFNMWLYILRTYPSSYYFLNSYIKDEFRNIVLKYNKKETNER